jgi:hypothetical protein
MFTRIKAGFYTNTQGLSWKMQQNYALSINFLMQNPPVFRILWAVDPRRLKLIVL